MSISLPPNPLLVIFQNGASFTHIGGAGSTSAGSAFWSTGYSYSGGLQNFLAHGHGSQTNPRGHVYTGQWAYGKANGIGTYVDSDGHTYRGCWVDGLRQGVGVTVSAMGDRDVSGWLEGKRHGYGTTRWKREGDVRGWRNVYTGGLKRGDFCGWGEKVLSDGTKYIGGFKNNEYWGYGTLYTEEGRKKGEGGFKNNKFHGPVVVTENLESGGQSIEEKFFRDGVVDQFPPSVGMTFPVIDLQTSMEGALYQNDISHTPSGVITWAGGYYTGALDGGYPHGYGMIVHVNGGVLQQWYEGGWDYGRANGYGEYSVAVTGDRYVGGFKDGKLHGFGHVGKTVLEVTTWTETFWKNGVQVG